MTKVATVRLELVIYSAIIHDDHEKNLSFHTKAVILADRQTDRQTKRLFS